MEHWIWLAQALGAGSPKADVLIRRMGGAGQVYAATPAQLERIPELTARDRFRLGNKSLEGAQAIVGRCMELGCRILTRGDASYPARLGEIYAPPGVLYVMGGAGIESDSAMVSIVGTRKVTEYGVQAATRLAMGLASHGVVVVSGLAYGVDTAAHKGALKGGGKTIAVIGCGVDWDYPAGNRELKRLIAANGAVVSEYPPGTRPYTANFPIRNRIIAGLSLGTVVVEAGGRSGALITASLAAEAGRDVFAVPGSIFSPMSEGTNRLLRDGAKPCCGALDVLEEYIDFLPQSLNTGRDDSAAEEPPVPIPDAPADSAQAAPRRSPKPNLSRTQETVYALLSDTPVHVDEIALRANLEPRVVLSVLTVLEIQGLARSLPGRRYTAV